MLQITEQAKDEIVGVIANAVVPAQLGRALANIADFLNQLQKLPEPLVPAAESAPTPTSAPEVTETINPNQGE